MSGILDLDQLLSSLSPELLGDEFVFCTVAGSLKDYADLDPVASIRENEGLTLVLTSVTATREGFPFAEKHRCITLTVNSSLEAVGLTAAVSSALAANAIPANIVAGYHHDHVFVPADKAEEALQVLLALSGYPG